VELNPVRARLTAKPDDFRWTSASAYLCGKDDMLVKVAPLLGFIPDWRAFLDGGMKDTEIKVMRRDERAGRPLGNDLSLDRLEKRVGGTLRRLKPGPKQLARIEDGVPGTHVIHQKTPLFLFLAVVVGSPPAETPAPSID
jgi:putative transposase